MKSHTLLSVVVCAMSLLASSLSHAQGLRVPGSSSFGNDWRVGSQQGGAPGYGSSSSAGSYGSPTDNPGSQQYGGAASSYGTPSAGSAIGSSNPNSASGGGNSPSGLRPSQPVAPRSPGGGLRTN